jgi:hypothetical protein
MLKKVSPQLPGVFRVTARSLSKRFLFAEGLFPATLFMPTRKWYVGEGAPMKSLTRCFATVVLSLGVFSAMAPSAMANSAVFIFNDPNQLISGIVTYNPITTEVTGRNISITQLDEGGGPFLPVTGACGGGCLDFKFGPTGESFSLTGAVPDANINTSTTLFAVTGSFSSAEFIREAPIGVVVLTGADTKAPALLSYFGLPITEPFTFGASITALSAINPNVFSEVEAVTVVNASVGAIPEPSSIILLLTAIAATLLLYRLRSRRSKRVVS